MQHTRYALYVQFTGRPVVGRRTQLRLELAKGIFPRRR